MCVTVRTPDALCENPEIFAQPRGIVAHISLFLIFISNICSFFHKLLKNSVEKFFCRTLSRYNRNNSNPTAEIKSILYPQRLQLPSADPRRQPHRPFSRSLFPLLRTGGAVGYVPLLPVEVGFHDVPNRMKCNGWNSIAGRPLFASLIKKPGQTKSPGVLYNAPHYKPPAFSLRYKTMILYGRAFFHRVPR